MSEANLNSNRLYECIRINEKPIHATAPGNADANSFGNSHCQSIKVLTVVSRLAFSFLIRLKVNKDTNEASVSCEYCYELLKGAGIS